MKTNLIIPGQPQEPDGPTLKDVIKDLQSLGTTHNKLVLAVQAIMGKLEEHEYRLHKLEQGEKQ